MPEEKITFILGAGASTDYGIYTQGLLPERIKQHFSNSPNNFEKVMNEFGVEIDTIKDFREALYDSSGSIDEWLEVNERYRILGKKILSLLLLNCEKEFDIRKTGWYPILYQKYLKPRNIEDFSTQNQRFSFITFNYDRSLEYFLHRVLTSHFSEQQDIAVSELKKLKILHVHGSFGPLSYQDPMNCIPYGKFPKEIEHTRNDKFDPTPYAKYVEMASKNISLMFTDNSNGDYEKARNIITNSSKIFFLGFGYHEHNLRKLGFDSLSNNNVKVKGTHRLSDTDILKINRLTNGVINEKALVNSDCVKFISDIEANIYGFK